ncbi:glycosyltransferase family 4 protein [Flavisolibacter ginsenosidimutans]|uniref:Glycosyltransferase family 4 protein n=1 Tax=Flavisolibacter ginsenosidimutans TaxID=661481 RepID=A0A5B8UKW4_9BACT|nr:glycosyltransferase family 4 protein [Flavisolibacter ginsenosidimutans]QEC56655.1 glycosyltransferase family 4 protein [Flavisolibacter ginsenosidimutans]
MKIVSTGYINTAEFSEPLAWLERINFHAGTLEELAKLHEVISIEQINYNGELIHKGVAYHFLNFQKPKLYVPRQLHRHIKRLEPDAVIVHGLHFPFQVMQLRKALGASVKIIVQNHAEKPQKGWRKGLQRLADRCVDGYLFTAKETGKEWVGKGIVANDKKIVEVMEASSVFYSQEAIANKGDASNNFLWVGRLDENKDPLTVVKAFLRFVEVEPSAKLNMIYHEDGLLPQIESLLKKSKIKNAVRLIGKVPHAALEKYFREANFIVSGSHYEGSGIAVCEAMSCGCIPVLTNIASFRKMTGHGKCGLLYEAGNAEALFETLRKSMTLNKEREREKVLRQFNSELSFKAIAAKINETLLSFNV